MAIDCAQLQTEYDEICVAIRLRMQGKTRTMVKDGEKEVAYAAVKLETMIAERDRMADLLRTACSIDVSGAGPRLYSPPIGRTY